jgi:hypothetical protein
MRQVGGEEVLCGRRAKMPESMPLRGSDREIVKNQLAASEESA